MRSPRIKVRDSVGVYHCISRIVGGDLCLDSEEREHFRCLMWKAADFCGVDIITYSVMPNHTHILVRIPRPHTPPDKELVRRVKDFYGRGHPFAQLISDQFKARGQLDPDLRQRLLDRMHDLSQFNKELKQRFTRWYNHRHQRIGTLWADRFKSLLAENQPRAVIPLSAYIDLNSVRAGLTTEPAQYRWCGYAEAVSGGQKKARQTLAEYLPGQSWNDQSAYYRQWMFARAAIPGHSKKRALTVSQVRAEIARGGRLSVPELLQFRIRYFVDGAVLGSERFVQAQHRKFKHCFGQQRAVGPKTMKGADWQDLRILRQLRKQVFG